MLPFIGHITFEPAEHKAPTSDHYFRNISAKFPTATSLKNTSANDTLFIAGGFESSTAEQHVAHFSGEIYNLNEIATLIHDASVNMHDKAALVLNLILKKGIQSVERINGQFLILYYNKQEKRLYIINDHFGIHQLYYYQHQDFFLFGSEIKLLLAHPACPKEIDWEASLKRPTANNVLYCGRSYKTYFKEINLLPPACVLTVNVENRECKIENYLKERFRGKYDYSADNRTSTGVMEEYISLLEDAVKIRAADGDVCYSLLSGGLDSSAIGGLAARHKPVQTFSIITQLTWAEGFTRICNRLSRDLQIKNSQFLVPVHELFFDYELAKKRVWRAESPVNHTDAFTKTLLHYAIKKVRPEVTALLTGTGSDQLNGGLARWVVNDTELKENKWEDFYTAIIDVENQKLVSRKDEPLWFRRHLINRDYLVSLSGNNVEENPWMFYVDSALHAQTYTLVWDEVRASSFHGHTTRFPFLDFRFLPFISKIPPRLHKDLFFDKQILREPLKKILPEYVIEKPKVAAMNPDYDLNFKLFNFLTATPEKIIEEALGDINQPHPVINKKELVKKIIKLQQEPQISEWYDVMHIINTGFLAQLPYKDEKDLDIESSMHEVQEILFDDVEKTKVFLQERLSIKKEKIDLEKPLSLAEGCLLLHDKTSDKYFLAKDNTLAFEIEEQPWIDFLNTIDNQKSIQQLLNETKIEYGAIEEYLDTAVKEKILTT